MEVREMKNDSTYLRDDIIRTCQNQFWTDQYCWTGKRYRMNWRTEEHLEYPSCLQAETPSQLFQPSEQMVLQTPPLWTCRTELLPLRRTDTHIQVEFAQLAWR